MALDIPNNTEIFKQRDVRETTTTPKTPITQYLSIPACAWIPTNPDVLDVTIQENRSISQQNGILWKAPVNLPQGAIVTACIVYGNAAATAETWSLKRASLPDSGTNLLATANFDTEDTSIDNGTIDNSTFVYMLSSSTMDISDDINGARITYTIS